MINKDEVDLYFTKNHSKLKEYATKLIYKYRRNYKPDVVITEAYLNVIDCIEKEKISNVYELDVFSKQGIWYKVRQESSNLNAKKKIDRQSIKECDISDMWSDINIFCDSDIEYEIDKVFSEYKKTLSKFDLIEFEIIYDKGYNTPKKISEYLDISNTYSYDIIRRVNRNLRDFINKKNK